MRMRAMLLKWKEGELFEEMYPNFSAAGECREESTLGKDPET